MPLFDFDFARDIRLLYADRLRRLGVPTEADSSLETIIGRFFSLAHRQIETRARSAQWSIELRQRFPDLPADIQTAIRDIERIATEGGDLNPYQSRDLLRRPWKPDYQMLEWGILHFHLGIRPDPKHIGMIEGTADLLFSIVEPGTIYFVDVAPHRFSDDTLFATATRNWPHLFDGCQLQVELPFYPSSAGRAKLRKAGIEVLTIGDGGKVYVGVGEGQTLAGIPRTIFERFVRPRVTTIRTWSDLCRHSPQRLLSILPRTPSNEDKISLNATESDRGEIVIVATYQNGDRVVVGSDDQDSNAAPNDGTRAVHERR